MPPEKGEISKKERKEPQQRTYSQEKCPGDFTTGEKKIIKNKRLREEENKPRLDKLYLV